jgi:hypothetical protein
VNLLQFFVSEMKLNSLGALRRLTYDVVAGGLSIQNLHETRAGLMLSKEGIRLLAYGTPKLIFRELF